MSERTAPPGIGYRFIVFVNTVAPRFRPRVQTALIRSAYSGLSVLLKNDDSAFLNYGYAPLDASATPLQLTPEDEFDRLSSQLYFRVAGARELRGKDVLEIGCGRGGGASFIARYLEPASVTAVDLSAAAVRYCRRRHPHQRLTFVRGEAERLALPSNSFDAVVNVESSHCYPSFDRFVAEVGRVLRPGGLFLLADLRGQSDVAVMRECLRARFTITDEEVITANVIRALELQTDRRTFLIEKRAPRFLHNTLKAFAAVRGSSTFDAFTSGRLQYVRFVLEKKDEL